MSPQPTRRALIGTASLASVIAAMPITAFAVPSTSIERQWLERCTAFREFEADPLVLDDNERANDYWDRIDSAEVAILNSPDTSPRAAELRLWVGWSHCQHSRGEGADTAINLGDVPVLLHIRSSLDWHEKLIFAAILNLREEG